MESMGTHGPNHGYPCNPWVPMGSVGTHGCHGYRPWIQSVPMDTRGSVCSHGIRGYAGIPWVPMNSMGTHGSHEYQSNPWDPWISWVHIDSCVSMDSRINPMRLDVGELLSHSVIMTGFRLTSPPDLNVLKESTNIPAVLQHMFYMYDVVSKC